MYYYTIKRENKTDVSVCVLDTDYPESDEKYDLCVCHYTNMIFTRKDGIVVGGVIPQAKIAYLCHPLGSVARKESVKLFNEYEQNCNTCKYLERIKFDKNEYKSASGLMPGKCLSQNSKPLYKREGNSILFAPDDCMIQECYESR